MNFETNREVLDWYEQQPRTLTKEFIGNINWSEVKKHPLDKRFVPVLLYMRDVETLTDVYYEELRRTPTGKDPIISKFMERWSAEEQTHGEVLNRFLNEAGIDTDPKWQKQVVNSVSTSYTVTNYLITTLTNLIGKRFTATHMAFGAIHEMSTTQGYRRLVELANHPILSEILRGIVREESAHTTFFGQGAKSKQESDYTIATLFGGEEGLEWIDKNVSQRIQTLPGFDGLTKISDKIGEIVRRKTVRV